MQMKHLGKMIAVGVLFGFVAVSAQANQLQLQVKKPDRATPKPDLIVYLVDENYSQPGKIRVTIRNIGQANAGSAVLLVQNMTAGGKGEASVPSLAPNGVKQLDVVLSHPPKKGDRLRIVVDSKNHVPESNETNNTKFVSY